MHVFNSFAALSDSDIILGSSLMSVDFPHDKFAVVNTVRDLEDARSCLSDKISISDHSNDLSVSTKDDGTVPLYLTWISPEEEIEIPFTPEESKKTKRNNGRKSVVVSLPRPNTRIQEPKNKKCESGAAVHPPDRASRAKALPKRYR